MIVVHIYPCMHVNLNGILKTHVESRAEATARDLKKTNPTFSLLLRCNDLCINVLLSIRDTTITYQLFYLPRLNAVLFACMLLAPLMYVWLPV